MRKNRMILALVFILSIVLSACSHFETQQFGDSTSEEISNSEKVEDKEHFSQTDEDLFKVVKRIGKLKSVTSGNEYVIVQDTITGCFYIHYAYDYRMAMTPYYDETGTAVKGCYENPNNKYSNE